MISLKFTCGGITLNEDTPLDFGETPAGVSSAVKSVTVRNTGDSDADQCKVTAVRASLGNGFVDDIQVGAANETYTAQQFSDKPDGKWYRIGVVGIGKDFDKVKGGKLLAGGGSDDFFTRWTPPKDTVAGRKVWGNVFTCVYK